MGPVHDGRPLTIRTTIEPSSYHQVSVSSPVEALIQIDGFSWLWIIKHDQNWHGSMLSILGAHHRRADELRTTGYARSVGVHKHLFCQSILFWSAMPVLKNTFIPKNHCTHNGSNIVTALVIDPCDTWLCGIIPDGFALDDCTNPVYHASPLWKLYVYMYILNKLLPSWVYDCPPKQGMVQVTVSKPQILCSSQAECYSSHIVAHVTGYVDTPSLTRQSPLPHLPPEQLHPRWLPRWQCFLAPLCGKNSHSHNEKKPLAITHVTQSPATPQQPKRPLR